MSQIHQMQTSFVPEQDRVLFRLTTSGRQLHEFRFWLTRRYVRLLWQALLNMLEKRQPKQYQDESAKSVALEVEHQQTVKKANFDSTYQAGTVFPLGEDPILVAKIALREGPKGGQFLRLHPMKGEGIDLNLNNQTLHSLCQLLARASKKAEWDLDLDFAQAQDLINKRKLN